MNVLYKYCIVLIFALALQNMFAQECNYIYVSPTGTSSGIAGTKATPANFAYGLTLVNASNRIIRMASGTYSLTAPLSIPSNITIEGGYNVSTWIKSNATATIINKDNSNVIASPNRLIGLSCVNVSGFRLLDLTINVASAVGDGVSVYGIYINNCTNYVISRCKVNVGNGSDGLPGVAGTPGTDGAVGSVGETGEDTIGNCCRAGGIAACCSFPGSYAGGNGGTGGTQGGFVVDTTVIFGITLYSASGDYSNDGLPGLFGLGYGGVPGGAGGTGVCQLQYYQQCMQDPAQNGGKHGTLGIDGLPGHVGIQGIATYAAGYYTPGTGTIGTQGKNGGGGGGGGGGGAKGCQPAILNPSTGDTLSYVAGSGGGGGGGGEGGEGGFTAFGGKGAGASFAIFVWANGINGVVRDCALTPGLGGTGGAGGIGGAGGVGGLGGLGGHLTNDSTGIHSCDVGEGGQGGQGGHGGQGGNGGAGSDGASLALYQQPAQEPVLVSNMYNPFEPTVTAEFSGCSNSTVTFTTVATGNVNWVFGVGANPATASGSNVTVQYDSGTPGFRSITLIIDGVPYPLANFINIPTDFPPPQITASKIVACIGDPVNFSTTGTAVTYNWNIPGGSISSSAVQNPGNATFTTVGTHTVTLTTTSCCGVSVTTKDIQVISAPTVNIGRDTTMCITDQKPLLDAGNPGASYQWKLNGTVVGSNTQTFQTTVPGTYSVDVSYGSCSANDAMTLTIYNHLPVRLGSDILLCTTSTLPVLDAGISDMQTYLWTMNSNPVGMNTQTLQSIAGGTYEVTVTSPTGCVGKDTIILTIKDPVVELGNNYTICANGSHPILDAGNTGVASYSWRLNGVHTGGNTQTLQTTTAGIYAVTVTSPAGCSALDSLTLTILPALNAAFNVPSTATVGASVSFTDNSSPVPTGWDWSFGDGSANSSIQNPAHTYTTAGQYPVFLIIDNTSCSDTITTLITIQNNCGTLGLTAAFHTSDDTVFLNGLGIINCTNTSVNSESWLWNFGDGTTSVDQNPSHVYTVSGTYTITLTSYNHNCSTSITSTVIVVKGAAGVDELEIADYKLQVYPNPNNGKFTLQIDDCPECLGKVEDLVVMNMLGEKVLQMSKINTQSVIVDLSKYPKGIYYVKLLFPPSATGANKNINEVIVKKVIVN